MLRTEFLCNPLVAEKFIILNHLQLYQYFLLIKHEYANHVNLPNIVLLCPNLVGCGSLSSIICEFASPAWLTDD